MESGAEEPDASGGSASSLASDAFKLNVRRSGAEHAALSAPAVTAAPPRSVSQIVTGSKNESPMAAASLETDAARRDSDAPNDAEARELARADQEDTLTSSVIAQIKEFTSGWRKGVAVGTGVRNRTLQHSDQQSPQDPSRLAMSRSLTLAGEPVYSKRRPAEPVPETTEAGETHEADRRKEKARPAPESVVAAERPVSTFSLYVSDASFRVAADALAQGRLPVPGDLRIEEFTNAFDYGDPAPTGDVPVAFAQEQVADPQTPGARLVRMTLRTATEGRAASQRLNLTLALDVSGSMKRQDRADALRLATRSLAAQLSEEDLLSIIVFDRTGELATDRARGADAAKALYAAVARPRTNGTNIEEGLRMAAEHAKRIRDEGAINRVVLVTDGIANLGSKLPEPVKVIVRDLRAVGIATDVVGVSPRDLDKRLLEEIARSGDGRHLVVDDNPEDAGRFAAQLAGSFRPAASNVKLQVRFNPRRVETYRLMGFERHLLEEKDFRNDSVDAAELAAAEGATALYRVRTLPDGYGDIGTASIRFLETSSGRVVEHTWVIPYADPVDSLDQASASMRLAVAATLLGDALAHPGTYGTDELDFLRQSLASAPGLVRSHRVNQLLDMLENRPASWRAANTRACSMVFFAMKVEPANWKRE